MRPSPLFVQEEGPRASLPRRLWEPLAGSRSPVLAVAAGLALACTSAPSQEPLTTQALVAPSSSETTEATTDGKPAGTGGPALAVNTETASPRQEPPAQRQAAVATPNQAPEASALPPGDSTIKAGQEITKKDARPSLLEFIGELREDGNRGSLWLGTLDGNGDREVLIYIPGGADPKANFRLIYHFHGTYSENVERHVEGQKKRVWVGWDRLRQTIDGADALQAQGPDNVALIYPFSAGKRMEPAWKGWSNKAYDRMWMEPGPAEFKDSFPELDAEVTTLLVDRLGVHPSKLPEQVIVEGHSAGGIALWNIARHDNGRVSDYLFLDAGFHLWADGCYSELEAHKLVKNHRSRVVLVIRDGGIADPEAGPNSWCIDHPAFVEAWPTVAERCAASPKERPKNAPGRGKVRCDEWQEIAEGWPAVEAWCEGMADDMREIDGVVVHRTKVVHGEQPRAFFGGLGIPEMRPRSAAK